jgi:hypothetical protein
LGEKILFPDKALSPAEQPNVVSRPENVKNRLDQVENHIDLLFAISSEFKQTVNHNQQNQLNFQQTVTQHLSYLDQKFDDL